MNIYFISLPNFKHMAVKFMMSFSSTRYHFGIGTKRLKSNDNLAYVILILKNLSIWQTQ